MSAIAFKTSSNLVSAPATTPVFLIEIDKDGLLVLGDPNPSELVPELDPKHLGLSAANPVVKVPTTSGLVGFVLQQNTESNAEIQEIGGSIARAFSDSPLLTIYSGGAMDELALAEGIALGAYNFNNYKTKKSVSAIKVVTFVTTNSFTAGQLKKIQTLAESVHNVRDLVNTPANDIFPQAVAAWSTKQVAAIKGLEIEIWDEKRLLKERCGGLVAVGQGSVRPPRLVKITWSPRGAKANLALVGKGITFDTGGLSLKPAASMVGMKYDMTGAATVINTIIAIAKLNLNVKVTAWACLAENMPSGSATRPNDVIRARNGKTIEVMNTDAEGRLVLADGLSLASEAKPDMIVDIATLTGAATVALGNRFAGLMGDEAVVGLVESSANQAGELVWHMPLPSELRSVLDSPVADLANAKIGHSAGGMLIGGLFLKEFVGKGKDGQQIPWAHLDIAGPANNDKEAYGYTPKGGTGALLRTLVALAEQLSAR